MLFFYTQKNHKQGKKEKKNIFYSLAELTQRKMEISCSLQSVVLSWEKGEILGTFLY